MDSLKSIAFGNPRDARSLIKDYPAVEVLNRSLKMDIPKNVILFIIKMRLKELVRSQIEIKKVLHKPHTSETYNNQIEHSNNRFKITALHIIHNRLTGKQPLNRNHHNSNDAVNSYIVFYDKELKGGIVQWKNKLL